MKADIDYRHIYGLHIAFHKICKAIPFEGQRGPEGMTMSQVYQTWYRDEYPKTGTKFETLYTIWKSEPAELKFHYPFIQNNSQKTTQKDKQPQNPNEDRIDFYHELSSSVGVSYPLYDIKPDPYPLTTFEKIRRLGIPALPYAFAKLKEGDLDVLPLINYWTDNALEKAIEQNAIPKEKIQAFSLGWWEENKNKWAMPDILAMKKLNPS
ncbi:MAG: hypothetical protein RBU29_02835 [bacterium]|nr:hypothetical protein [bacterium]